METKAMMNTQTLRHELALGILMLKEELSKEMRKSHPEFTRLVQLKERLNTAEQECLRLQIEILKQGQA
jgi:hypothetical protein